MKSRNILLIIIMMLVLAVLGVISYYTFLARETLTKDSYLVKQLYKYVSTDQDSTNEIWTAVLSNKNDTVYMKDLDQSTKNYIGFSHIELDGTYIRYCTESPVKEIFEIYKTEKPTSKINCGYYNRSLDLKNYSDYTLVIASSYVKKSVEDIFGKNSYQDAYFSRINSENGYIFDEKSGTYTYGESRIETIDATYKTNITGVTSNKDTLTLNIDLKVTTSDSSSDSKYKVTYKLLDNNYYLYSIQIVEGKKVTINTNNSTNNTEEKTEVLTKDSAVVKELYSYIALKNKTVDENAIWDLVTLSKDASYYVETKNILPEVKNQFALAYVASAGLSTVKCEDKYDSTIKAVDKSMACGLLDAKTDYKVHNTNTTKVKEQYLKLAVEKIFGTGSYTAKTFGGYFEKYVYYKPDKAYILSSKTAGALGYESVTTTLKDVSNTKDTLILKISTVISYIDENNPKNVDYNFTYKLDNGNYYLYSIGIVKG